MKVKVSEASGPVLDWMVVMTEADWDEFFKEDAI